jgi:hypothetical protein
LEALTNVNLSEYVWVYSPLNTIFGGLPTAAADASGGEKFAMILLRELPGILLIFVYLFLLPPLLAATVFRNFYVKMGFLRYMVFIQLVLWMAALPLKMVLRWVVNLKYLVAIPEYFFNI